MNLWKIFMCTNANSICKFYFPCLNFFFTELMSPLAMYKITYPARTLRALGLLLADGAPDFQQNVKMAVSPLFRPGPDPLSKTKTKTMTMTKTPME